MIKLLNANFLRLKKEISFWLVAGVTFGITILSVIDYYVMNIKYEKSDMDVEALTLNSMLFALVPVIGIIISFFIASYLGREYANNAIKNKIIAGRSRQSIYLANYVVCLVGSLFIYAMLFAGAFGLGIPMLGGWQGETSRLVVYIIVGVFLTASMASIITMVCMLCSKRSVSAVSVILISAALVIFASIIYNQLAIPEMSSEMIFTKNGVEYSDPQPNPLYIDGVHRKIFEFLMQFLPTCQGILMDHEEITQPVMNVVYSVITILAVNICGISAFRKKDIK